jgi:hypothetical protein
MAKARKKAKRKAPNPDGGAQSDLYLIAFDDQPALIVLATSQVDRRSLRDALHACADQVSLTSIDAEQARQLVAGQVPEELLDADELGENEDADDTEADAGDRDDGR